MHYKQKAFVKIILTTNIYPISICVWEEPGNEATDLSSTTCLHPIVLLRLSH